MHHQFKELADVDITAEPMEVGPTCHYVMGGIEVDADTAAAARVPGLFASGEVAGGMHGSNRLGGNSLSDLLVFGKRSGEGAAAYVKALHGEYPGDHRRADRRLRGRPRWPRWRSRTARTPTSCTPSCSRCMNDLVGIIRKRSEIEDALERLEKLKERAQHVAGAGHAGLQPRLAPRPGPAQHAHRGRVHREGRADPRGVARRAHPRRLPRDVGDVAAGQPDLLAERRRRRHRRRRAADGADAAGPARPVHEGRAEEVLHRRGDRRRARRRRHGWRRRDRQ